ncbi:heme oxygenase-like protein [Aureobasidium sp. EXF-10728]|nr:heme oxygenase-like protein [Aureobasidium sp. EXF-10728]
MASLQTPPPLLSPPPSPAPQNLSTEINTATRSVHTRLNKLIVSRLPLALPPIAKSPELYAHGINTFGDIYLVFENCWQVLIAEVEKSTAAGISHDKDLRQWLSQLVPPGLWRSDAIKKDLEYLETATGADLEAVSNEQLRSFTSHIYRQTREKPHVLVAYAWIMYMAIFSGGRWIREQLTESGPEFWGITHEADKTEYWIHGTLRPGFTLFCFSGTRDGEDIKTDFKTRLEKAEELLTAHERKDIIDEAQFIFEQCVAIVEALDKQLMTDLELVKSLAAREAKHGHSHLKMAPTRAALPPNAAPKVEETKSAGFIRAIVVALFAFAFYQSYRWQYGNLEDA